MTLLIGTDTIILPQNILQIIKYYVCGLVHICFSHHAHILHSQDLSWAFVVSVSRDQPGFEGC